MKRTSEETLTTKEAAELAGVTISTIDLWKRRGDIVPVTMDEGSGPGRRSLRYRRADIERMAKDRTASRINPKTTRSLVAVDQDTFDRLSRIVAKGKLGGEKVTLASIVCGALEKMNDDRLLDLGIRWLKNRG